MKQILIRASMLAILTVGANQQALAHVSYVDITATGTSTNSFFTNYGWGQGLIQPSATPPAQGALVTTDDVGFYSFTLTQASDVTLSFTNVGLTAAQNPLTALGLSLYSGQVVTQSFDVTHDTNPGYSVAPGEFGLVNTAASFHLTTAGAYAPTYLANERTLTFIGNSSDAGTGTATLVEHNLAAGVYSIVAGGNLAYTPIEDANSVYGGKISLAAVPAVAAVPVPAAFWLMGTALAGFRLFGQRKNRLAA